MKNRLNRLQEHDRVYRNTQCTCLYPFLIHDNSDVYRCQKCGGWKRLGFVYAEDVSEIEKELRFWRVMTILFIAIAVAILFINEMTVENLKSIGGVHR